MGPRTIEIHHNVHGVSKRLNKINNTRNPAAAITSYIYRTSRSYLARLMFGHLFFCV